MPPYFFTVMLLFICVLNLVFYVIIPGILILVYSRADVRLTCETRNPLASWTDRCPLPVLGIALLYGSTLMFSPMSFC